MATGVAGRLLIPVLVICYCGYMIFEQMMGSYRTETRSYTFFLAGAAIVLAGVAIVRSLMGKEPRSSDDDDIGEDSAPATWAQYRSMILLLVGAAAVVLTIEVMGYLVAFTAFIFFALLVLGVRSRKQLVLIPFVTMSVIHLLLVKLLSLPLPAGFLRGII